MNQYHFRFNSGKKSLPIILWFFATLLAIACNLLAAFTPIIPWLLALSFPLMGIAIYQLIKKSRERQSTETISLHPEGFSSTCFGSILFTEISTIRLSVRDISLLGGLPYDYYLRTENNFPITEFFISTQNGKTLNWILQEWGGLYNSKEDFSAFFHFLTALTDQLYQLYHSNQAHGKYLKILDEEGRWEKLSTPAPHFSIN
uniref:hypothetical protein n=1 Tax=Pedobacter schmidteae TaxID=2201271 RepID=UPI000EB3EDDE|nr:hypothetical protein [Pedobacter schmidteae]